ncbi:MAG: hypothetical protein EBZ72_08475 [Burkholderiaceae bacterium]|nr:hypothetical protein [Burkholderiaceae bacterium]
MAILFLILVRFCSNNYFISYCMLTVYKNSIVCKWGSLIYLWDLLDIELSKYLFTYKLLIYK